MFRTVLIAAALAAPALPALAHVTFAEAEAEVGSTYRAVLRVPHGCGSEATNVVRVQIPEGFYNVKPMPHAGWELDTVVGPYATAFDNHGTLMTEGVREIVWSGGDLPTDWYDEFVFRGTFGSDLAPGSVIHFPVVQECATAEEAWIDTTGAADAAMPAPSVTLTEAQGHGH